MMFQFFFSVCSKVRLLKVNICVSLHCSNNTYLVVTRYILLLNYVSEIFKTLLLMSVPTVLFLFLDLTHIEIRKIEDLSRH